jgi:hypothetical protein
MQQANRCCLVDHRFSAVLISLETVILALLSPDELGLPH